VIPQLGRALVGAVGLVHEQLLSGQDTLLQNPSSFRLLHQILYCELTGNVCNYFS
jgi:hypothetical protein